MQLTFIISGSSSRLASIIRVDLIQSVEGCEQRLRLPEKRKTSAPDLNVDNSTGVSRLRTQDYTINFYLDVQDASLQYGFQMCQPLQSCELISSNKSLFSYLDLRITVNTHTHIYNSNKSWNSLFCATNALEVGCRQYLIKRLK